MKKEEQVSRRSGRRVILENDVLTAYNRVRKQRPQSSPTDCYTLVGEQFSINYYQVQYIIIKARKAGKKVL